MAIPPSDSLHTLVIVAYSLSHAQFFCNPMDYSLPGSSVRGISQARILEWVATAQVAIVKEMTGRNRAAQLEIVKQMSRQ